MIPSSAAMLRNLQQNPMATPSFSMESLLQSGGAKSSDTPTSPDLTSLTLNCWASFMAYQRADAENLARIQQSNQQRNLETAKQQRSSASPSRPHPDDADNSAMDSNNSVDEDRNSGAESIAEEPKTVDERDNSRISEETCSCGEEHCTGGSACRRIQEKEKPMLKFSVNAILGDNHDRRPNPGNLNLFFK